MQATPSPDQIRADVRRALEEDVGSGDLTASLVPADRQVTATIVCRLGPVAVRPSPPIGSDNSRSPCRCAVLFRKRSNFVR